MESEGCVNRCENKDFEVERTSLKIHFALQEYNVNFQEMSDVNCTTCEVEIPRRVLVWVHKNVLHVNVFMVTEIMK
jgi:hypothetical protein